ncbi:PepSY domain-containing protein [Emcibacter sp.]|uniref:PepSY domain-containing protein n=1 Tax=Emcibacter sp. TaxID=1979954 RepID=UPI003A8FB53D
MGILKTGRITVLILVLALSGSGLCHAFAPVSVALAQNAIIQTVPSQRRQPSVMQRMKPTSKRETAPFSGHDRVQQAVRNGEIVSLSRIRRTVKQSYPGRIVDVQLLELNNRNVPYLYVVKVLTEDGRLLDVTLNARDATVLRVQGRNKK